MAVALDSDAVIGILDRSDALHPAADAKLKELLSAGERLVASVVTYAEVLTGAKLGHHDEGVVEGFFADLISETLSAQPETARLAAELRGEHAALGMPDALILASAELHPDVDRLVCGDRRVAKVKGLGLSFDVLGRRA